MREPVRACFQDCVANEKAALATDFKEENGINSVGS